MTIVSLKNTAMFTDHNCPEERGILTMDTFEKTGFLSKSHKVVPVVIDKYKKSHVPGFQNSLKFLMSCDMTVSQLLYIVRHRLKLSLDHAFHLFYNKGRTAVMMSQQLGEISSKYKDPKGILCFIFAAQNTFGCRVPRIKPIKSKFPGIEPNPFGAPEPSPWLDDMLFEEQESEESMMPSENIESAFLHHLFVQGLHSISFEPQILPALGASNLTQTGPTAMSNLPDTPSAISSNSVPMEVSQSPNIFLHSLSTLQHSLDQFTPLSQLDYMPLPPTMDTVLGTWEHTPLVNSMNQLAEALLNHLSVTSYEPNQIEALNAISQPSSDPSSFIFSPFDQEMLNQSNINSGYSPLGHLTLPVSPSAILHTLNLANTAMTVVLHQLNTSSSSNATEAAQFGMLIPYFQQVTQHLGFQTIIATSVSMHHSNPMLATFVPDSVHGNQHNSPALVGSANPAPSGFWPPTVSVDSFLSNASNSYTDSDSSNEEEDAGEYFCDILI